MIKERRIGDEVKTDMGFMTMSKLLSDYTFTDGSPCGVEE